MRENRAAAAAEGALLAFALSFGSCACLLTGFEMAASAQAVALACLCCAVLCSICFTCGKGWIAVVCAAAALLLAWRAGTLSAGVEAVLNHLSIWYNNAYRCGVIAWSDHVPTHADRTAGLCILGALGAFGAAYAASGGRCAWVGTLPALSMAALCFVVTDSVPSTWALALLLLALLMLRLTASVRRRSRTMGTRLSALLALPTAAFLCALLLLIPRTARAPDLQPQELIAKVTQWVQSLLPQQTPSVPSEGSVPSGLREYYTLSNLGEKSGSSVPVMTVEGIGGDTIYLRGEAFAAYDGVGWASAEGEWDTAGYADGDYTDSLKITTNSVQPLIYFAYVPSVLSGFGTVTQAGVANTRALTAYNMPYRVGAGFYESANTPLAQYRALPEDTMLAARQILLDAGIAPRAESAEEIVELVRGSAEYDLNPSRMPQDAQDFAIWFLTDAERGYCVHFASAATVLLRAAGVPARFVTGYMVSGITGSSAVVRVRHAHAWVEYYDDARGWLVADPTPASSETQSELPTAPETSEAPHTAPTRPAETTPRTEPPAPTGATAPQEAGEASAALRTALTVLAALAAPCVLLLGQWKLRLTLHLRRRAAGTPNEQALARWREARRLSRLTRRAMPARLTELAQKARFSAHTLTDAELACFDAYRDACLAQLRGLPLPKRTLLRLISALW